MIGAIDHIDDMFSPMPFSNKPGALGCRRRRLRRDGDNALQLLPNNARLSDENSHCSSHDRMRAKVLLRIFFGGCVPKWLLQSSDTSTRDMAESSSKLIMASRSEPGTALEMCQISEHGRSCTRGSEAG